MSLRAKAVGSALSIHCEMATGVTKRGTHDLTYTHVCTPILARAAAAARVLHVKQMSVPIAVRT